MMKFVVGAAAIAQASVVHADELTIERERSDGWRTVSLEGECLTTRSYEDGDLLIVLYNPNDDTVYFGFTNAHSTSIEDGQQVPLYVHFGSGPRVDSDWGSSNFTAKVLSDGERRFTGKFDGRDMLEDIGKSDVVAFTIDEDLERLVGAYRLDGSARAMADLRKCAFEKKGLNPEDPFLK